MFGVFDTAFHCTIPEHAALYGLPLELAQKHKIRRYGFHGISHRYLMLRYAQLANKPASKLKLIPLHLEGGSSAAAIRDGQSADTSMGFTPLEGLLMGTRSGDLDPAIVSYLIRKEGWTGNEVEQFLDQNAACSGCRVFQPIRACCETASRSLLQRARRKHILLSRLQIRWRISNRAWSSGCYRRRGRYQREYT